MLSPEQQSVNLKAIYNAVPQKDQIGDYGTFEKAMSNPINAKAFYDHFNPKLNFGDYGTFGKAIGVSGALNDQQKQDIITQQGGQPQGYNSPLNPASMDLPTTGIGALQKATQYQNPEPNPDDARIAQVGKNIMGNVKSGIGEGSGDVAQNFSEVSPVDIAMMTPVVGAGVSAVKGIIEGHDQGAKGIEQIQNGDIWTGITNTLAGTAKGAFGVASLINPELMAFNTATDVVGDVAHLNKNTGLAFDVLGSLPSTTINAVSQWAGQPDAPEWAKNSGELLDTVGQMFIFHKGGELLGKATTSLDLTKAFSAKELNDYAKTVTPDAIEQFKQTVSPQAVQDINSQLYQKFSETLPDNIKKLQSDHDVLDAKKTILQQRLEDPNLPDVAKTTLQGQYDTIDAEQQKLSQKINEKTLEHQDNVKQHQELSDEVSESEKDKGSLQSVLYSEDDPDIKKLYQDKIDELDKKIEESQKGIEKLGLPKEITNAESDQNKSIGISGEVVPDQSTEEGQAQKPSDEIPMDQNLPLGDRDGQELKQPIVEPIKEQTDATQQVENQASGQPEHQNGDESGEATETSNSNSPISTEASKEKEVNPDEESIQQAVDHFKDQKNITVSKIQKELKVGYAKAARMVNEVNARLEEPLNNNNNETELRKEQNGQDGGQKGTNENEAQSETKNDSKENGNQEVLKEGAENAPKTADEKIQSAKSKLEAIRNRKKLEGEQGIQTQKSGFSFDADELEAYKELVSGYIEKGIDTSLEIVKKLREDFGDMLQGATYKDIKDQIIGELPEKEVKKSEKLGSVKKEAVNPEKESFDVEDKKPKVTDEQNRAKGESLYKGGGVPDLIKTLINGKKKSVEPHEVWAMKYYRTHELDPHVTGVTDSLAKAQKDVNIGDMMDSISDMHDLSQKYKDFYEANDKLASIAGHSLRAFRDILGDNYSHAQILKRAFVAKLGEDLTPEEHRFYKNAIEEHQKAIKALEEYQKENEQKSKEKEAQVIIDKENEVAKKTVSRKGTIERIREERQQSKDIISKALAKQRGEARASLIPTLPVEVYRELGKIAKGFVHEGVIKLSDIVDKTLNELKDVAPNITKEHIIQALSGDYPKEIKTKTEIQKNIAEVQKLAKLTTKLDQLENGIVNKRSITKGGDSPAVKKLKDQIKTEHDKLFPKDTKEEIASKRYKTYLENKLKGLQDQIAKGDYSKPEPRISRVSDAKELALKAEVGRTKTVIDQKIYEQERASEKWYQKVANTLHKIRMFNLISSPLVFAKVLGHSLSEFAVHPFDEASEFAMRKGSDLLGGKNNSLSEKGAPTMTSLKEYYKALVSSRTYKDVWTQLSTYRNNLELAHGEKIGDVDDSYKHLPVNTFEKIADSAGNLHAAEKLVLEHATYRESYAKRASQFLKQNDGRPMTPEQSSLAEGGAMVDALESIMRNRTALSDLANSLGHGKTTAAKGANLLMKILTPIRKVPLNIARQVAMRIGGLPYGAGEAIAHGIKRLNGGEVSPKAIDNTYKHLSKGTVGLLLFGVGLMNPDIFGGLYDLKRKREDVSAAGIKGIPDWLAKVMSANPLMLTVQMGATMRRNLDNKFYGETRSVPKIVGNTAAGITEEIPYINAPTELMDATSSTKAAALYFEKLTNTFYTPTFSGQVAAMSDTNKEYESWQSGHTQKRQVGDKDSKIEGSFGDRVKTSLGKDFPHDWSDSWKYHYPGLRETLKKR